MFFIDLEQFCLSRKREERIGKSDERTERQKQCF